MSSDRTFHLLMGTLVLVLMAAVAVMVILVKQSLHDTRRVSVDNGKKMDAILCILDFPPDVRTQTDIEACLKEAP